MGNHTFLGLVTSWDQIHQPHSILLAYSLRKNSENTPTKHTPAKAAHGEKKKAPHKSESPSKK